MGSNDVEPRGSMSYDKEHYERYKAIDVRKYSLHWWSNRYFSKLVRRYVPDGILLEIGCGTGFFLSEMGGYFEAYGVDISPFALEHARENCPRADIRCMRAEDVGDFPPAHFDVIIARHVLEHLEEPHKVMRECAKVLRPRGLLLFVVPHTDSLARRWKGEAWYGYRDETHVSLLSSTEWLRMTRESGLEVQKAYSDGFWDVPYVPLLPNWLQKCIFGSLGGIQALLNLSFVPVSLGEALIVVARKPAGTDGSACRIEAGGNIPSG
jgi:SAM-dependent methyltransferase